MTSFVLSLREGWRPSNDGVDLAAFRTLRAPGRGKRGCGNWASFRFWRPKNVPQGLKPYSFYGLYRPD